MSKPKLTPFFPAGMKPARPGLYLATIWADQTWYRYWDGKKWSVGDSTKCYAMLPRNMLPSSYSAYVKWRGLASDPKGAA